MESTTHNRLLYNIAHTHLLHALNDGLFLYIVQGAWAVYSCLC